MAGRWPCAKLMAQLWPRVVQTPAALQELCCPRALVCAPQGHSSQSRIGSAAFKHSSSERHGRGAGCKRFVNELGGGMESIASAAEQALAPHVAWLLRGGEGSPCYAIVDHVLSRGDAFRLREACQAARPGLRPTGVGRGLTARDGDRDRSDLRAWVTERAMDAVSKLSTGEGGAPVDKLDEALALLVSLQTAVAGQMPELQVDPPSRSRSEAQLTCYPGGGSRYVRHLDAFSTTPGDDAAAGRDARRVTAILYLNADWEPAHGGRLRLFPPCAGRAHVDVDPVFGRLLLFRSELVAHEVLPSHAQRWALTLWMRGKAAVAGAPAVAATAPLLAAVASDRASAVAAAGASDAADAAPPARQRPRPPGCRAVRYVVPASPLHASAPPLPGRIFVSVPAYREPDLVPTLQSLFEAARDPSRLRVGLVVQADEGADGDALSRPASALLTPAARAWAVSALRVIRCSSADAAGPVWARHLCWSLWRHEPYVLGIDSHTRFVDGFDDILIGQLAAAERQLEREAGAPSGALGGQPRKAVLTTYPAAYRWPGERPSPSGEVWVSESALHLPTVIRRSAAAHTTSDGFPRLAAAHWATEPLAAAVAASSGAFAEAAAGPHTTEPGEPDLGSGGSAAPARAASSCKQPDSAPPARLFVEPLRCNEWGACLTFSRPDFWLQVPPDPGMRFLFFGEEPTTLLRALSRGFAVFAPGQPVCVHRWERSGRPSFREHASGWRTAQQVAAERVARRLLLQASATPGAAIPMLPWPRGAGPAPPGCACTDDCGLPCELDAPSAKATLEAAGTASAARRAEWLASATLAAGHAGGGRLGLGPWPLPDPESDASLRARLELGAEAARRFGCPSSSGTSGPA